MKTLVIDIDDTLIRSNRVSCRRCGRITYKNAKPIQDEIDYLNILFDRGYKIILYTGRGWDCYKFTVEQLFKFGVKYHDLVMGKPQGIYIDKDAKTTLKDFL